MINNLRIGLFFSFWMLAVACHKESVTAPPPLPPAQTALLKSLELECHNWWMDDNTGKFVNIIPNILTVMDTSHGATISVYLIEHNIDISLDKPFHYRGGVLWYELTEKDLILHFDPDKRLLYIPFYHKHIRLVTS